MYKDMTGEGRSTRQGKVDMHKYKTGEGSYVQEQDRGRYICTSARHGEVDMYKCKTGEGRYVQIQDRGR